MVSNHKFIRHGGKGDGCVLIINFNYGKRHNRSNAIAGTARLHHNRANI